jgi:cytochrome c oxidase cbb3-type subunit I/II
VPAISSVEPHLLKYREEIFTYAKDATCHSQMINHSGQKRKIRRYSKAGEYVYDHPFLWGSKRTGPDLHRVGKKYPNVWHYLHMYDPRQISPGSIMPEYPWPRSKHSKYRPHPKITALRKIGVPYEQGFEDRSIDDLTRQAEEIASDLQKNGAGVSGDKEIIALIAYLQRLGTDIKGDKTTVNKEVK